MFAGTENNELVSLFVLFVFRAIRVLQLNYS
jgi:hypothetical protein